MTETRADGDGRTLAAGLYADSFPAIERYVDILSSQGIAHGLIGPRELDRLWERHVLNSAALGPLLPAGVAVADVGSGAGLPGLPLAILRPDLRVTLVEPMQRRVDFLADAVRELGLSARVVVIRERAEQLRETFDVVTCRAVAPLTRLIGWCAPLFPSGQLLALKGQSAGDEVRAAAAVLRRARLTAEVLSVRACAGADPTTAVRVVPIG